MRFVIAFVYYADSIFFCALLPTADLCYFSALIACLSLNGVLSASYTAAVVIQKFFRIANAVAVDFGKVIWEFFCRARFNELFAILYRIVARPT